jgi:hypothetical protein
VKLAIMQPYFLPYIGYFQLLNAVDNFIVYDKIQFSKKGWVQRNRLLLDGKDHLFSLPLKNDSDFFNIDQRYLADSYARERDRTLRIIKLAYNKAPCYSTAMPVIEECFYFDNKNLFQFVFYSIKKIKDYLEIPTNLIVSSDVTIDNGLSGQDRVIALCNAMKAKVYFNAVGGRELYNKEDFAKYGIDLFFIKTNEFSYPQFGNRFVANLSIIDLMMFNSVDNIKAMLNNYELVL